MVDDLVYIPRVGFRSANAPGTREKHVVRRGGATLSVEISPIRDACKVNIEIVGADVTPPTDNDYFERGLFAPYPEFGTLAITDDAGRDVSARVPGWHGAGWIRRTADGEVTLGFGTVIRPLDHDVRRVTIGLNGAAGAWQVDVPLEPAGLQGPAGYPIDASDTQRGVRLHARTIARTSELTAIEIEARLDPPDAADATVKRSLRGIGCSLGGGRLCGDRLFLRDEDGNVRFEHGFGAFDQGPGLSREVATFPPLPDGVRTVTLESEFMWVHHLSEERVRVPLPGETDVMLAGYRGRVTVTRLPGVYTEGAVRVEFAPSDPEADEQLAYIGGVNTEVANRTGFRMSHALGQRPIIEVPEPTGTATDVELRGPVVQLRGPWRLRIALPEDEPSVF
ncbi:MAG TPA: hypothetical protein VJP45_10635 [Candidatus Limnocylindria bacterium]|nr:hypothetical protein [Candidatus Limnocylindria bacterium]